MRLHHLNCGSINVPAGAALIPKRAFADEGQMIDPSVSVPIASAHKLAATATAEPELEPHGFRSRA